MRGGAFYRLAPDLRAELARRRIGEIVELEIDRLRVGSIEIVEGELVAVAHSSIGTGTDFAVVRFAGDLTEDRAFSLATVRSIRNPQRPSS